MKRLALVVYGLAALVVAVVLLAVAGGALSNVVWRLFMGGWHAADVW